ncbi:MAG: hypothetical protein ABWY52_09020 [Candidatus Limnocylindrales bacterium]
MNAFIIAGKDRPGELADVAEAIAERGVNVENAACLTWSGQGAIGIVTNDDAATRSVLASRGFGYREVELVMCTLDDKPGTLAAAARKLAAAGVNVELVLPTGMSGDKVSVAFGTNDPARARTALGEMAMAHA